MFFSNGERYEGMFKDDRMEGQGSERQLSVNARRILFLSEWRKI